MYLVVTRSFPPELGGMQNLMWGLSNSLSKHFESVVGVEELLLARTTDFL